MTTMNYYAVSRDINLCELAKYADFDAHFEVIQKYSRIDGEPYIYRIIPDVYCCTAPDGREFARIGEGFFFNLRGTLPDYPIVFEPGLLYLTPKNFNTRSNLACMEPVLKARGYHRPDLIPTHWKEEKVDNPRFTGDFLTLYGKCKGKFYSGIQNHWHLGCE